MWDKLFFLSLIVVVAVGFWVLDRRRERAWREFTERDHCERKNFHRRVLESMDQATRKIFD